MREEQLGPGMTLGLPEGSFPLGEDSLALGEFATVRSGWRVCDLGCGCGTLLALLALRERSLELFGIEVDEEAAAAARENLARNGLSGGIVTGDLEDRDLLPREGFSLVISNPPYFAQGAGPPGGGARTERGGGLEGLCAAAGRLLKSGGRFAVVFRPERLAQLLCAMHEHRLEPKRMQLMAHGADRPPSAVLVEGRKNGRPGLTVLPTRLRKGN